VCAGGRMYGCCNAATQGCALAHTLVAQLWPGGWQAQLEKLQKEIELRARQAGLAPLVDSTNVDVALTVRTP
jgi:hypothetical protein